MGSYYNIITKYEDAIYERGETNHYVVKIRDVDNKNAVDPSSVSITITNLCGDVLVNDESMTSSASGTYYYNYTLPDDAIFGVYEIKVTASSPTLVSKYKDKFYVLPWNAIYDVRRYSGITSKKSISEHDIAGIIWESYLRALDEVYENVSGEWPDCNPDTGEWFNGINKVFATKQSPIADSNGDGVVTGYMEQSCGTDISGWWQDEDGDCHRLKITVNDAQCGNITIEQLDGTALPSSINWVQLDYNIEWETFDKALFKLAVAYLAAHECIIRFKELDKATMADLHSNKTVILNERDRMFKNYRKTMNKIKRPNIGAGYIPGDN